MPRKFIEHISIENNKVSIKKTNFCLNNLVIIQACLYVYIKDISLLYSGKIKLSVELRASHATSRKLDYEVGTECLNTKPPSISYTYAGCSA